MTRLDWAWYRWRNPLHCHGALPGGADCRYVARGVFKFQAMRRHQKRVHGSGEDQRNA